MALTTYFKADNVTALNLAGSWDTTGGRPAGPPPSAITSRARWDNTVLSARNASLGAAWTYGQVKVVNPGGACTISGAALLLTLNPTDGDAAGVSIDMSEATQNFTIDTAVALAGTNNIFSFGTTNKTLTVSRAISGATFGLTITGQGLFTSTIANTFGSSGGQTFTLANGAVHQTRANSMGSALNSVVVGAGCFLDCAAIAIPNQTVFSVTGDGTWSNASSPLRRSAAILLPNAFNGKTVTLTGTSAVVAIEGSSTVTSKFTGTLSAGGTIEFVCTGTGSQTSAITNTTNDFYAPGGVTISSRNISSNTANTGGYSVLASDALAGTNETAIFGSVLNSITISTTGKLYAVPTAGTTRNIGRALTFAGNATNDAIDHGASAATTLAFTNDLTFSGTGGDVGVSGPGLVSFRKTISGAGGLRLSTTGFVEFNSAEVNAFSSWTGAVRSQGGPSLFLYTAGYSTLTNAFVASSGATIQGGPALGATLAHASYTLGGTVTFQGNALNLGAGSVTAAASTILATSTTVTAPGNITGAGTLSKTLAGTLILSGANTGFTNLAWSAGDLCLNSNGSTSTSTATVTQLSTGVLDNTSVSDVNLTATGNWNWNAASMTWGGTRNLTRNGNLLTSATTSRTLTFVTSKTAYLKFTGTIFGSAAYLINVGGGVAGAKSRLWVVGANLSTANTTTGSNSVTAGYYRIGNNDGLGASAQTIVWAVSSGGAIELDSGVTTPATKNGTFVGSGPDNNDGALRATTGGTNKWQGAISIPSTSGARFTAAAGATLTLDAAGSPAYSGLDGPTGSSCPVYFDAGVSATLNQDRALAATIGAVYCGNNGSSSGRVVLSKDNNNTGPLTCESGTTALTNKDAIGAGGVKVNPTATLAVEVPSNDYKAVYPGTTTLGGASASKAFVRIGT